MERYRHLNTYYKEKFGERTLKICLDGGFTCPNRDGSKGVGGCLFCGEKGSGERLGKGSIQAQLASYFSSYRSKRASSFIAYFQNFTSSYDSLEHLKEKYDAAISDPRIKGLSIATRPDCVNEEFCLLLDSYQSKVAVMVELGLQTSNEHIHEILNQKITNQDFIQAMALLNAHHIETIVHLMVGLPEQTHQDIEETCSFLAKFNYQGIKIHSTYVIENTSLAKLYQEGKYTPLTLENYVDEVLYILTHISPEVVIHRLSGDPPKDILLAPSWATHKKIVLNTISKRLEKENLSQGMFYKKS